VSVNSLYILYMKEEIGKEKGITIFVCNLGRKVNEPVSVASSH